MHIYELFKIVRARPGFYLDDEKSIRRLTTVRTLIVEYQLVTQMLLLILRCRLCK